MTRDEAIVALARSIIKTERGYEFSFDEAGAVLDGYAAAARVAALDEAERIARRESTLWRERSHSWVVATSIADRIAAERGCLGRGGMSGSR